MEILKSYDKIFVGIATIEEAKAIYEAIPKEHRNLIPVVGINVHIQGTSEIDDIQWDALYGNSIDLSSLGLMLLSNAVPKSEECKEA